MPRNQIIDAFRGFAIISVIIYHYLFTWKEFVGYTYHFPAFFEAGENGVQIFFVISGLVISMTILNAESVSGFAVRRFARLFPALLACCSLTFLVENNFGPSIFHKSLSDYFMSLLLLAQQTGFRFVDGSYWTLLIEIEFYALVALGYLMLKEKFWIVAVMGAFVRYKHMVFFLIGMWVYFYIFDRENRAVKWLLPICTFYLGLYIGQHPFAENAYIVCAITALLVLLDLFPNLKCEPLAFIGRVSYPLYLIHQNLGIMILKTLKQNNFSDAFGILAAVSCCLAIAILVHYAVEIPAKEIIVSFWKKKNYPLSSFS